MEQVSPDDPRIDAALMLARKMSKAADGAPLPDVWNALLNLLAVVAENFFDDEARFKAGMEVLHVLGCDVVVAHRSDEGAVH